MSDETRTRNFNLGQCLILALGELPPGAMASVARRPDGARRVSLAYDEALIEDIGLVSARLSIECDLDEPTVKSEDGYLKVVWEVAP